MVPRKYEYAKQLDNVNKNTKCQDSTNLEISQLYGYNTFTNHVVGKTAPQGYKRIRAHLIYDIKHDGRHKARCAADSHLINIPIDSINSGVVSLRGLRIVMFLAELNKLYQWETVIGNVYLEAKIWGETRSYLSHQ